MLVMHLQFEEGTGTTLTDVVNGYTFTTSGSPAFGGGRRGDYGLVFDGTDDLIDADSYYGVTGTSALSVGLWMKTTSTDLQVLAEWGNRIVNGGSFGIYINAFPATTGDTSLVFSCASGGLVWDSPEVFDGDWHHVMMTKPSSGGLSSIKCYVDGVSKGVPGATADFGVGTINVSGDRVRLGNQVASGATAAFFTGSMDEVQLWDHELTSTEVLEVFEGPPRMGLMLRGAAAITSRFDHASRGVYSLGYDPLAMAMRGAAAIYRETARAERGGAGIMVACGRGERGASAYVSPYARAERGASVLRRAFRRTERGAAYFAIQIAAEFRGRSRIANDALDRYELYRGVDAAADLTAAPWQTFTSLPYDTPTLDPSHTYDFVLRRRNRWSLVSQNVDAWSIELDADGNVVQPKPSAPVNVILSAAAGGTAVLHARYAYAGDGAAQADQWLVYVTTDGGDPDPGTDTPVEVEIIKTDGVARLRYAIAAQTEGTVIKALVRTRRSGTPDADSVSSAVVSCVATLAGPTAVSLGSIHLGTVAGQQQ